jgi:hypothetical protein
MSDLGLNQSGHLDPLTEWSVVIKQVKLNGKCNFWLYGVFKTLFFKSINKKFIS